jgi:L-rhamnose isomerase
MSGEISDGFIAEQNAPRLEALKEDYGHLGRQLARRGVDIERHRAGNRFRVAVPSWASGGLASRDSPAPEAARRLRKIEDCDVLAGPVTGDLASTSVDSGSPAEGAVRRARGLSSTR